MTREEIDKVIERAETFNSEDRSNRGSEYVTEHGLIGAIEAAQLYINRLLAAVKQLRKERQWHPIETAPRDGSEILAFNARGDMNLIFWHEENGWDHSFYHGFSVHTPIHWMPVPDAPQDFINDRIEKGRR